MIARAADVAGSSLDLHTHVRVYVHTCVHFGKEYKHLVTDVVAAAALVCADTQ